LIVTIDVALGDGDEWSARAFSAIVQKSQNARSGTVLQLHCGYHTYQNLKLFGLTNSPVGWCRIAKTR
jgi:hypothetical protein